MRLNNPSGILLKRKNLAKEGRHRLKPRYHLILTWDIRPGQEQKYSEFINNRLAPGLVEIGLPPSDVFYTTYGAAPQIMVILDVPNQATLKKAIHSERFAKLKQALMELIDNYDQRLIEAKTGSYF